MDPREIIKMERLWNDRSINGIMPTFQIAVLLPQIRKDFEIDEDALEEKLEELDKVENGLITKEVFEKICHHFLATKRM